MVGPVHQALDLERPGGKVDLGNAEGGVDAIEVLVGGNDGSDTRGVDHGALGHGPSGVARFRQNHVQTAGRDGVRPLQEHAPAGRGPDRQDGKRPGHSHEGAAAEPHQPRVANGLWQFLCLHELQQQRQRPHAGRGGQQRADQGQHGRELRLRDPSNGGNDSEYRKAKLRDPRLPHPGHADDRTQAKTNYNDGDEQRKLVVGAEYRDREVLGELRR